MTEGVLEVGDVVQIDPTLEDSFFGGCFMLVTKLKSFGAMGFIAMPGKRGMLEQAYYRAKWEEMELVGKATWVSRPRRQPTSWSAVTGAMSTAASSKAAR
jgi:hypothetical protein